MADHGHAADIPQMDYPEHERTYVGFVHFAEVGTLACLAIVAALAVAVLWLGVELHRVRRDVAWHRMEWRDEARQTAANVADLYGMMEGRDD